MASSDLSAGNRNSSCTSTRCMLGLRTRSTAMPSETEIEPTPSNAARIWLPRFCNSSPYRGLPIGSYVSEDGNRRKLGSRISEAAGKAGGNFLTPEIAHTARPEAAYREIGALIDAERPATNLLSSMPLTFNLLAPWARTRTRVELSGRAAAGFHRRGAPASLRTFPRPRQPEVYGRLHRLRRADPLLRLPWPQRLCRLRDQIFGEHARAHAGTEAAPRRTLGRERPLHRARRRGAPDQPPSAILARKSPRPEHDRQRAL